MIARLIRRIVIAIVGATVVLVGVVMLFTPGPAVVVIPAGIAILATEFLWARRILKHAKEKAAGMIRGNGAPESPEKKE